MRVHVIKLGRIPSILAKTAVKQMKWPRHRR